MVDLSKVFMNAVLNQYKKGYFTVDYAILEASKLSDKNKINATDYEELITYLAEEQAKEMQTESEITEETTETVEDTAENEMIEDTEKNEVVEDTEETTEREEK